MKVGTGRARGCKCAVLAGGMMFSAAANISTDVGYVVVGSAGHYALRSHTLLSASLRENSLHLKSTAMTKHGHFAI